MKKENLGSVVILIGVAFIGFIWFTRNKLNIADKQLADINAKSNALNTGSVGGLDKPFKYTEGQRANAGGNPYTASLYSDKEVKDWYKNMTPAELEALKKSIGNIPDPSAIFTGQVVLNNESLNSLNQLSNYDFSKIDWSNIKIN
jgi:hypothetical protein